MTLADQHDRCAINCTEPPTFSEAVARMRPSEAVPEPVLHFISSSLSRNSQRAYAADLVHFRSSGRDIPCTPECVAAYLAGLAETHAVSTIQRRLAAIRKAHRALGHDDPCQAEIVKATMRGISRTKGLAQREAQALQRDDLFAVLRLMGDHTIDMRDRALLLIGFAGGFRRSELVGLDVGDVEHVRQGIVLHLRRSKTDQRGHGRRIAVPFGRTRWCPVHHLTSWLTHGSIEKGPLFRTINRHGHILPDRLSGEAVSNIIKKRAAAAGYNPSYYSGHSLRAGLATSAAMEGAAMWKIRQQTGHASDAMLSRYIRNGDMFIDNVAGALL